MSFLESLLNYPYVWHWVSFCVILFALTLAPIFFKEHPKNPPLSPRLQCLLLWAARLYAMFCVWYLAVMFCLAPTILTPPDKQLFRLHFFSKVYETVSMKYVLLTASTPTGTLHLKFLDHPLGYPWLSLMVSQDEDAMPAAWMVFAALDKVHYALTYSYLGRLWGQQDGGALGKRVLQHSMVIHLVSGLLVDVGALVIRNFFDATYLGENWRNSTSTMIIVAHLITALSEMMEVEPRATVSGFAWLIEKVRTTLDRLGMVAPRNTKTTSPTPTHEKEDKGGPSAHESGPATKGEDGVPAEVPAVSMQSRRQLVGRKTVVDAGSQIDPKAEDASAI